MQSSWSHSTPLCSYHGTLARLYSKVSATDTIISTSIAYVRAAISSLQAVHGWFSICLALTTRRVLLCICRTNAALFSRMYGLLALLQARERYSITGVDGTHLPSLAMVRIW